MSSSERNDGGTLLSNEQIVTVEGNTAAVRRLADEGFKRRNMAVVDEIVSAGMIDHHPFPGQQPGPDGVKSIINMFYAAFPDAQFTNEHIFGDGDLVADHWHMEGTHGGPFMGIPPTGKRVRVEGIEIFRLNGGQIVERWAQVDSFGLLKQLGAIPEPGHGAPRSS